MFGRTAPFRRSLQIGLQSAVACPIFSLIANVVKVRYDDLMNRRVRHLALAAVCIFTFSLWAQPAPQQGDDPDQATNAPGADALYEVGFHLGSLLPNQVNGVSEIMGLGGLRVGMRMSPLSYFETGFITGNGSGQEWKNLHADFRMDIPVETLVGLAYVGADTVYFKGPGHSTQLVFGGHAGGGVQMHLTGVTWFRTDMKFGFSPGTSLYIGFGLVWRLGGGGSGAG
jgi:hypothetical protein